MPRVVPDHHGPIALRSACVGQPVSSMGTFHHTESLAFLLGGVPETVAAWRWGPDHSATPVTYAAYQRSPGAQIVCVEVELSPVAGMTLKVAAAIAGATRLAGSELDGVEIIASEASYQRRHVMRRAFFDVTALATNAIAEVSVTLFGVTGAFAQDCRCSVFEVPQRTLDPVADPTNEQGVDAGWTAAGNDLFDGSATTPRGFNRIVGQLDNARMLVRRHWQLCDGETIAPAVVPNKYQTASAVLVNMLQGSGALRLRARRLWAAAPVANGNLYVASIRYLAVAGGTVRFAVTGVGTGVTTNYDFALGASAVWVRSAPFAFVLPTDGTLQEADVVPQFKTANVASPLYISNAAAIEAEV